MTEKLLKFISIVKAGDKLQLQMRKNLLNEDWNVWTQKVFAIEMNCQKDFSIENLWSRKHYFSFSFDFKHKNQKIWFKLNPKFMTERMIENRIYKK